MWLLWEAISWELGDTNWCDYLFGALMIAIILFIPVITIVKLFRLSGLNIVIYAYLFLNMMWWLYECLILYRNIKSRYNYLKKY